MFCTCDRITSNIKYMCMMSPNNILILTTCRRHTDTRGRAPSLLVTSLIKMDIRNPLSQPEYFYTVKSVRWRVWVSHLILPGLSSGLRQSRICLICLPHLVISDQLRHPSSPAPPRYPAGLPSYSLHVCNKTKLTRSSLENVKYRVVLVVLCCIPRLTAATLYFPVKKSWLFLPERAFPFSGWFRITWQIPLSLFSRSTEPPLYFLRKSLMSDNSSLTPL